MKKLDRWERMVKERLEKDGGLWSDSAADLLRQEHRWVRKMVNAHNRSIKGVEANGIGTDWKNGYNRACMEILNKLKERAK